MDEMAAFFERCRERDLQGYPPIDFDAIREGRPQPAPPARGPEPGREPEPEPDERVAPPGARPDGPSRSARSGTGRTAVFTVRLTRADLALLERRAFVLGDTPSALARTLITRGLRAGGAAGGAAGGSAELAEAVRGVQDAAARLRAALPAQ